MLAIGITLVRAFLYDQLGTTGRADHAHVMDTARKIAYPHACGRMHTPARRVDHRKFMATRIALLDSIDRLSHIDQILNFLRFKQQKTHIAVTLPIMPVVLESL